MIGTLGGIGQTRDRPGRVQINDPDLLEPTDPARGMPHKRKLELLKSKLEHMRKDAAEMAKLADSIQEDLEKTTENELPLRVVNQAEQVEKLAKRIKNTAKGF
jgi:hypothetical protein